MHSSEQQREQASEVLGLSCAHLWVWVMFKVTPLNFLPGDLYATLHFPSGATVSFTIPLGRLSFPPAASPPLTSFFLSCPSLLFPFPPLNTLFFFKKKVQVSEI